MAKLEVVRRLITALIIALALGLLLGVLGTRALTVEAASASTVLGLVGIKHVRIGNTIYIDSDYGTIGFRIEWHCSGIVTYIILIMMSVIMPLSRRSRAYWLLIGFLIIYLVNVARIFLVILIANKFGLGVATSVHNFVAPLLLIGTLIYLGIEMFMESITQKGA